MQIRKEYRLGKLWLHDLLKMTNFLQEEEDELNSRAGTAGKRDALPACE